jgi:hypothetical protein
MSGLFLLARGNAWQGARWQAAATVTKLIFTATLIPVVGVLGGAIASVEAKFTLNLLQYWSLKRLDERTVSRAL